MFLVATKLVRLCRLAMGCWLKSLLKITHSLRNRLNHIKNNCLCRYIISCQQWVIFSSLITYLVHRDRFYWPGTEICEKTQDSIWPMREGLTAKESTQYAPIGQYSPLLTYQDEVYYDVFANHYFLQKPVFRYTNSASTFIQHIILRV